MGWSKFVQKNRRFLRAGLPYVGTVFVAAWCLKEALSYRITVKDKELMVFDDMDINPADRAELEEKLLQEGKNILTDEDTLKRWNNPDVSTGTYSRARPQL